MSNTEFSLHFGYGLIHEIFAGDIEGIWEMINLLIWE